MTIEWKRVRERRVVSEMIGLYAALIREGTYCDYCILGDQNPMAKAYELVKRENRLLVSVKKETK